MKAVSLYNKQQIVEAVSIFEDLIETHPEAPLKLAECKMKQGLEYLSYDNSIARSFFDQVIKIKKQAPPKAQKKAFEKIEIRACLELAKVDFDLLQAEPPSQKKLEKIRANIQFIDNAPKKGSEDDFSTINQEYMQELTDLYYFFGKEYEKNYQLIEAIQFYSKMINLSGIPLLTKANAAARMGICQLKNNEMFEESLFGEIQNASDDIKTDFYFRYAKKLITKEKFKEAEYIVQKKLNIDSPVIEKLKQLINATKIERIGSEMDKINRAVDRFYENTFTLENFKSFCDSLDAEIEAIKPIVPSITEKIGQLKPALFNRLIFNCIEEKQFANAINIIQKSPSFWENPELLNNLGICCYSYASQGNLTENNYKIIISYFLTAVYSNKAMIKLSEQNHYDEVSETNISIEAVRKELLTQFESLLSQKINNPNLVNIAHRFFSSEKRAIERLGKVIDKDILYANPYFAKAFGINQTVVLALNEIYENNKNEEALEVGIPYVSDDSNVNIKSYAIAKKLIYKAIEAIQNENLDELKLLNSGEKLNYITQYKQIAAKSEELLFKSIASKITNNYNDEHLIPLMKEIIRFSNKSEKLRKQYSIYITNYCIRKINARLISNRKALSLMETAYTYLPDNAGICKNFITIIKFNLFDILNNKTKNATEIYSLLDKIHKERSLTFKHESVELKKAGNNILQELSKKGVDLSLFESKQYLTNPTARNVNAQEARARDVLSYFKKMSEV
jgi:hypothetical protein